MLNVGDFVLVVRGSAWGRIISVTEDYDHHGALYLVRYYTTDGTGELVCPDSRCGGRSTSCPICKGNYRARDLARVSDRDLAFYREDGMLPKEEQ